MKKIVFILMVFSSTFLFSLRNWDVYTNTNSVYSIFKDNTQLILGTSGGVSHFDLLDKTFNDVLTSNDGLSDYDIVDMVAKDNKAFYATKSKGVDIFENNKKTLSLNMNIGLISNKTSSIVSLNDYLFVGTDLGLSVFQMNGDFPYPLLINNYNNTNGLLNNAVNSLAINASGYLFISSINGLAMVHTDSLAFSDKWKYFKAINSNLQSDTIFDIYCKDNQVAISSKRGLYVSDMSKIFNANPWTQYFPADSVNAVYIDSQDNIWCSFGLWNETNQSFIQTVTNKQFACITEGNASVVFFQNEADRYYITDFVEYNGEMYAGNWGASIYKIYKSGDAYNIIDYQQDCINSNTVNKIKVDNNSGVWINDGFIGNINVKGSTGISYLKDGLWTRYNVKNSPLISNNIYSLLVDKQNRKWFGSWSTSTWPEGISILDDSDLDNPIWTTVNSGLYNNTISDLLCDPASEDVWVTSYREGVNILNNTLQVTGHFNVRGISNQAMISSLAVDSLIFFGTYDNGIAIWHGESVPNDQINSWFTIPTDLRSGKVNGICSTMNDSDRQTWFALDKGIYMYEDIYGQGTWYHYNIDRKRRIWNGSSFVEEILYYSDEERLFGANATTSTAIFADPFHRIWIGSATAGICIYDIANDKFINYTVDNSPLLSNYVTSFAYDPISGKLYIGTNKGLNSVEIGKSSRSSKVLGDIVVYPNPFYPERDGSVIMKNTASEIMPAGTNSCKIFDLNGLLVRELEENNYFEFEWNGKNENERLCGSGIYFYLIKTEKGSRKGKIVLIR